MMISLIPVSLGKQSVGYHPAIASSSHLSPYFPFLFTSREICLEAVTTLCFKADINGDSPYGTQHDVLDSLENQDISIIFEEVLNYRGFPPF